MTIGLNNMDQVNLQTIRESFGRVAYSHKTHEKEADKLTKDAGRLKWANAILTALTTGTLLTVLITDQRSVEVISASLAFLTLLVSLYGLSFNPEGTAAQHQQSAKSLWLIREKHVALMADIINEAISAEEIARRRDALAHELSLIYGAAQRTSPKSYRKAQKALQLNEELAFSNREINQLLPSSLHFEDPE